MLEKTRAEQAEHIAQLERVRDQQKAHIDMLSMEIGQLKGDNQGLCERIDALQREVQTATDFNVEL